MSHKTNWTENSQNSGMFMKGCLWKQPEDKLCGHQCTNIRKAQIPNVSLTTSSLLPLCAFVASIFIDLFVLLFLHRSAADSKCGICTCKLLLWTYIMSSEELTVEMKQVALKPEKISNSIRETKNSALEYKKTWTSMDDKGRLLDPFHGKEFGLVKISCTSREKAWNGLWSKAVWWVSMHSFQWRVVSTVY